ncbi:hypothetical protein KUCAC02_002796, partial [Chaenocephalus aceratus]
AVTCALSSAVIPPVAVVTASGRQTRPCHVGAALMLIGADGESFVPVCSPKAATCHCSPGKKTSSIDLFRFLPSCLSLSAPVSPRCLLIALRHERGGGCLPCRDGVCIDQAK